jgi:hypothetical protein
LSRLRLWAGKRCVMFHETPTRSHGNMHVADTRAPALGSTQLEGPVYAALVTIRLVEEEKRTNSLQARGLAIVTTSGTLVTLLFAIAKFGRSTEGSAKIPVAGRWVLAAAAVAFVGAAIGGLLANLPRLLVRPRLSSLAELIDSRWGTPAASAEKTVALARARQLRELERSNDGAARAVLGGLAAEVIAISLAAAAVVVTLAIG